MTDNYSIHPFFGHEGPVAKGIALIGRWMKALENPEPRIRTKIIRTFEITDGSCNFAQALLQMDPTRHEYIDDTHLANAANFPSVLGEKIKITMKRSGDGAALVPDRIFLPHGSQGAVILFQASCCYAAAVNAAIVYKKPDGEFAIHTVPSLTGRAISFIDGKPAWEIFSSVRVTTAQQVPQGQHPLMYAH